MRLEFVVILNSGLDPLCVLKTCWQELGVVNKKGIINPNVLTASQIQIAKICKHAIHIKKADAE